MSWSARYGPSLLASTTAPSGPPTHGSLSALRPHWWKWRTVISSSWNYADHINALELQAHLASLRWRTRTPQCVGVRSLHILYSQVALGILAKGRSPSLRLCRVVNKCNAICLTASYTTLLGYSRTDEHPADRASRAHGDDGETHNYQPQGSLEARSACTSRTITRPDYQLTTTV